MTYSVALWQISTIIMFGAQNILDISQYLTLSTWQLIFCGILVQSSATYTYEKIKKMTARFQSLEWLSSKT